MVLAASVVFPIVTSGAGGETDSALREFLRERTEAIRTGTRTELQGETIAATKAVPALYERRRFELAWTAPGKPEQLLRAIHDVEADGLDPSEYHMAALEKLREELAAASADAPALRVDYDLLLTDSLARLSYHILFGKVDPERFDPDWNFAREIPDFDPADALARVLEAPDLRDALEREKPQDRLYVDLKSGLAKYRAIRDAGGWKPVPEGPKLIKGEASPRVPALRARLVATGDLATDTPAGLGGTYDDGLAAAVAAFQVRHGLDADGAVGPRTLEALNVPVEVRIDQIRVNLERGRWLLHAIGDEFVVVNIAGFRLYYLRGGEVVWRTRVQVGKPYRATPVFRSRLSYLVFNPTWTVPPGILTNDILPAQKRDRSTLAKKGLEVLDLRGNRVPEESIDWDHVSASRFPYLLRQPPGENNALGRIKFMFPNDHAVYLHDTPSKDLFQKEDRAFSSGCIRVEDPLRLAELLLEGQSGWSRAEIDLAIASGTTRSVTLARPIPVWLSYWTAWVDAEGRVEFRRDLYGRDAKVLNGLEAPFRLRKRGV